MRWVAEDDDDAFYRELPEAEVIWHVLRPLSGPDLEKAARLKLIHKLGAGVNTIDVDTATGRGIAVANMPGANAPSVAEATVMLMLATMRRMPALDRATRQGRGWPADPALGDKVRDLGSCTVGLLGYGNIAKRIEQILRAMGANVLHTSTQRDEYNTSWASIQRTVGKERRRVAAPAVDPGHRAHRRRGRAGEDEAGLHPDQHIARRRSSTRLRWSRRCAAGTWRRRASTCSPTSRCPRTIRC